MYNAETGVECWWLGGHIDVVDIFCVGAVQLPGTGHITDTAISTVMSSLATLHKRMRGLSGIGLNTERENNVQHICILQ